MRKHIIFRKLFYREKERDFGFHIDSIIFFSKKVYTETVRHDENGRCWVVPEQYHIYLHIDLWFIVLRFDWLTKKLSTVDTDTSARV